MRVKYIDAAKGHLMLLVILGHILIVLNPDYTKLYCTLPQAFIYTFHMPAYFILHGLVFHVKKWHDQSAQKFVMHRLRTLIVPYCFFEVIGIIWKMIFFRQSFLTGVYNLITIRCNVGADWFLVAMFMGGLLFLIYVKCQNRVYGIASTIACFILPMVMSGNQLLIVLGRGLLAYAFIMCGCMLRKLFLNEKTKTLAWLFVSLVVTAWVAVINLKFGENDFYSCTIHNPLAFCVGGISGTILIISLSRKLLCELITEVIGRHTLTIMGTHQLAIYLVTDLFPAMKNGTLVHGLMLALTIAIFEVPVVWFIDGYLRSFTGKHARN